MYEFKQPTEIISQNEHYVWFSFAHGLYPGLGVGLGLGLGLGPGLGLGLGDQNKTHQDNHHQFDISTLRQKHHSQRKWSLMPHFS